MYKENENINQIIYPYTINIYSFGEENNSKRLLFFQILVYCFTMIVAQKIASSTLNYSNSSKTNSIPSPILHNLIYTTLLSFHPSLHSSLTFLLYYRTNYAVLFFLYISTIISCMPTSHRGRRICEYPSSHSLEFLSFA